MKTDLLVVTPVASFGEMIRQTISEHGPYQVHIAQDKADAILQAEERQCSLVILDLELGENAVLAIGRSLHKMDQHFDFVILADGDVPSSLDAIRPWVLLSKPFYLPDFVQLVRSVPDIPDPIIDILNEESPVEKEEEALDANEFPWLEDVSKAAQHLTRITLESSAQAALITRENELWAYAGQLSQNAANELARTVSRHWDGQKGNDLLRFVRLESTRAEHMLYATLLTTDVILSLVFDAETPFSTIRSQANSLARTMAVPSAGLSPAAAPEQDPATKREPVQAEYEASETAEDEDEDIVIPSISEILDEIPPPNPTVHDHPMMLQFDDEAEDSGDDFEEDLSIDTTIAETRPSTPVSSSDRHPSKESSPAIPLRDLMVADRSNEEDESQTDPVQDLDATLPSKSQKRRNTTPIRQPAPGELDETRPHSITEVAGRLIVEPASAAMAQLNYACLLVPRFTMHYMTGDVADRLAEWMPQICIAFGWRMEFLAVRPEYLQWVVNVTPNTSPGYLMRIMRQQTSQKLFAEFPRLKRENPSGDFWAPGYLIMGGMQPHPPQLVIDYIKQIRQRQGISQPRR